MTSTISPFSPISSCPRDAEFTLTRERKAACCKNWDQVNQIRLVLKIQFVLYEPFLYFHLNKTCITPLPPKKKSEKNLDDVQTQEAQRGNLCIRRRYAAFYYNKHAVDSLPH